MWGHARLHRVRSIPHRYSFICFLFRPGCGAMRDFIVYNPSYRLQSIPLLFFFLFSSRCDFFVYDPSHSPRATFLFLIFFFSNLGVGRCAFSSAVPRAVRPKPCFCVYSTAACMIYAWIYVLRHRVPRWKVWHLYVFPGYGGLTRSSLLCTSLRRLHALWHPRIRFFCPPIIPTRCSLSSLL